MLYIKSNRRFHICIVCIGGEQNKTKGKELILKKDLEQADFAISFKQIKKMSNLNTHPRIFICENLLKHWVYLNLEKIVRKKTHSTNFHT